LTVYRENGVKDMTQYAGSSFYDDDDDKDTSFISGDPFAKLKFEDLRRVHKEETVFNVSESDFANMKTYKTVEDYSQARSSQSFEQISKAEGERQLELQEQARINRMKEYQKQQYSRGLENERKQSEIKSMFLRLEERNQGFFQTSFSGKKHI
jgi:hypothetical protein